MKNTKQINAMNENLLKMVKTEIGSVFNMVKEGALKPDARLVGYIDLMSGLECGCLRIKKTICLIEAMHKGGYLTGDKYTDAVKDLNNEFIEVTGKCSKECFEFANKAQ